MDRSLLIHLATKPGIGSTPDTVRMPINNTLQIYRYSALAPGNDTITADAPGWVQGRLPIKVTTQGAVRLGQHHRRRPALELVGQRLRFAELHQLRGRARSR